MNDINSNDGCWRDRYRLRRGCFRWYVTAGTGTRPIGRFFRWKSAMRFAQELQTAFFDGKFVGERGLHPGEFTR